MEWSALQKEKSLGSQELEGEIERVVQHWKRSLRLIAALNYDGGELINTLCLEEWSVPIPLQKMVLDLYLKRSDSKPSQDVLMAVFANEPALRTSIVPLLTIHVQRKLIQTISGLVLFQTLLESWLRELNMMLRADTPDAAQWLLLTEDSAGLSDTSFPRVLREKISTNASDLASFWKKQTINRAARQKCIDQLLIPVCVEVLRRKELSLASHLSLYGDGWVGYQAILYLNQEHDQLLAQAKEARHIEREEFEAAASIEEMQKKKWNRVVIPSLYNPFVLQSLKYARDPQVRKGLSTMIPSLERWYAEKDLRLVREMERRKSNRFTKELS